MSNIDWDFGLLESLIQDRGDIVVVETGLACPACRNEDPYAVNVTLDNRPATIRSMYCPSCNGNGYIYRGARTVKGLVTAIRQGQHQLQDVGFSSPGDAVFSPSLAAGFIGEGDRITFTNPTQVDKGQLIIRGIATKGDNATLKTDLQSNEDRIWYRPESIQWCEDANGVVYYDNVDFKINGNRIVWINSPEVGTTYVIKYRAYTEWLVSESPMERYDRARNLAQKVLLKKKHVVFLNNTGN
jgi:signal peptidase I